MHASRWVALAAGLLAACATTQSRFVPLGAAYAPLPAKTPVDVFKTGMPDKPFVRVARLDVHLERSFAKMTVDDALPELIRQAQLAGANGIIEVDVRHSSVGETSIFHVSAVGIRFTEATEGP
jgi:hypothetical protein